MNSPLTDALASLVNSALPMQRFLNSLGPRPDVTPDEAAQIDQWDADMLDHWLQHHQ